MHSINIRHEEEHDLQAIHKLTVEAFEASELGHSGEAGLVDALRDASDDHLSLVATENNQEAILGHAFFSRVVLRSSDQEVLGMGLGPISVAPEQQRSGIGAALIARGLAEIFASGRSFVVVLGHPDYYPRFGFRPALDYGVRHGFAGIPQELFFLISHPDNPDSIWPEGRAYYQTEFGSQHLDCDSDSGSESDLEPGTRTGPAADQDLA